MHFIDKIKDKAIANPKTIVLPESNDERVIRAAARILEEGVADLVLLGDPERVRAAAQTYNVDVSKATVIDPQTTEKLEEYANILFELRQHKGMTLEKARETLKSDYTMFGVIMVKNNDADGLVSGACHSTANTLRPALQILKTTASAKLVSGFFILDVPDCTYGENGVFLFADCGLNQDPTAEELSAIAYDSALSFRYLVDAEPKVAFISHSTKGSAKHPLVTKMVEATNLTKAEHPDIECDGELQVDAALVPEVAATKAPGSKVAGHANVLVFPNLDCGNNGYKLVQRLCKAEAYGPMLQGIAKPVNDLSRGCSWRDIVGVVALTVVQAQLSD